MAVPATTETIVVYPLLLRIIEGQEDSHYTYATTSICIPPADGIFSVIDPHPDSFDFHEIHRNTLSNITDRGTLPHRLFHCSPNKNIQIVHFRGFTKPREGRNLGRIFTTVFAGVCNTRQLINCVKCVPLGFFVAKSTRTANAIAYA